MAMNERLELIEKTIWKAYDKSEKKLYECDEYIDNEVPDESKRCINISDISTKLVQETGRFAERFASDIIISINSLNHAIAETTVHSEPRLDVFGIRRDGVDHLEFVCSQIANNINNTSCVSDYYRKIYAVKTYVDGANGAHKKLIVEMKDIQSELSLEIYRMQDELRKL